MEQKKYKLARIVDRKGDLSKDWYVEFYIWDEIKNKQIRRRDYSVNSHKNKKDRLAACKNLRDETNARLVSGLHRTTTPEAEPKAGAFNIASSTFLQGLEYAHSLKKITLGVNTNVGIRVAISHMRNFLQFSGRSRILFKEFDSKIAHAFCDYLINTCGVGPKTHNNNKTYISLLINVFVRRELLASNPMAKVAKLKEETGSHFPYSSDQMKSIRKELEKDGGNQLLTFISFIYYTFIRPGELRNLTVDCIREKTIFVPGNISKNNRGQHVVIPESLEKIIQKNKLRSYPGHFYIFSKKKVPSETQIGGKYFYLKNAVLLKSLGYDKQKHDLYGYKHTGVINLYNACKDLKAVQRQCRHSTAQQTDTYLRDLGCITNKEALNFPEF